MKPGTLEDLIEQSDEFEEKLELFENLDSADTKCIELIKKIQLWFDECIKHGRFLPEVSADRKDLQSIVNLWTTLLRQRGENLERIIRLAPFDPEAGVPLPGPCPYPGLEAYGEGEDKKHFFKGRDQDITYSVEHFNSSNILLITGGSGAGKSSLAMAGILPRLKQDPSHSDWCFIPGFTPGDKPFDALASAITNFLKTPDQTYRISQELFENPSQAAEIFKELFKDKPVMLFIDQFEELLTLCQDQQRQKAFADLLCALANPIQSGEEKELAHSNYQILITLRTDHLAQFEYTESLQGLHDLLISKDNYKQLGGISFEDICLAIEIPAKEVGLRFLPTTILDSLASQAANLAGGLPLLQFALQRLWNLRKKNEQDQALDYINEDMLDELPDVQRALGRIAQDVYDKFDKKQQQLCQRLMLELVTMDESFDEPLRRRRPKEELCKILTQIHNCSNKEVKAVIDKFVGEGLLRESGEDEGICQIEVAHEAMFRNWETFRNWVAGEGAKKRLSEIKSITREAVDWAAHESGSAYLKLKDELLKSALILLNENWLAGSVNKEYVSACQKHEKNQKATERSAKRTKYLAYSVIAVFVIIYLFAGLHFKIKAQKLAQELEELYLQKDSTLLYLRLAAKNLTPPKQINLAYRKVIEDGGGFFRYELARALERTENTRIFPDNTKQVHIEGQGSAIFITNTGKDSSQSILKIARICADGTIDKEIAEINCKNNANCSERELSTFGISPPTKFTFDGDSRFVLLAFKAITGYELEAHQIAWENEACTQAGVSSSKPIVTELTFNAKGDNSNKKFTDSLNSADQLSFFSFDKTGTYAAFSTINNSIKEEKNPKSQLWLLNKTDKTWKQMPTMTTEGNESEIENIITAVAFNSINKNQGIENQIITGRYNGNGIRLKTK